MKSYFASEKYFDHLLEFPVVYVDVGARGEPTEPFLTWRARDPRAVHLIGFEPDSAEYQRLLARKLSLDEFFNTAVGSTEGDHAINLTKDPAASSILTPNLAMLKSEHRQNNWKYREVVRTENIKITPLDSLVLNPTAIKIDTQGYEYEVLKGAENTLVKPNCFCLQLETWTKPVYEGLTPSWKVMELLDLLGYELFFMEHGKWKRKSFKDTDLERGQPVWLELLYFKKIEILRNVNIASGDLVSCAILADNFGFKSYALEILEIVSSRGDQLEQRAKEIATFLCGRKLKLNWIQRALRRDRHVFPRLHA